MAEGSYRYTSAHVRPWVRPGTAGRWPVVNVSFALQAYHRLGPLRAAGLFKFLVPERGAVPSARFRQRLAAFHDDMDSLRAFGHDVVVDLCDRLLAGGAPGIHFYTMNQAGPCAAIWQALKR